MDEGPVRDWRGGGCWAIGTLRLTGLGADFRLLGIAGSGECKRCDADPVGLTRGRLWQKILRSVCTARAFVGPRNSLELRTDPCAAGARGGRALKACDWPWSVSERVTGGRGARAVEVSAVSALCIRQGEICAGRVASPGAATVADGRLATQGSPEEPSAPRAGAGRQLAREATPHRPAEEGREEEKEEERGRIAAALPRAPEDRLKAAAQQIGWQIELPPESVDRAVVGGDCDGAMKSSRPIGP